MLRDVAECVLTFCEDFKDLIVKSWKVEHTSVDMALRPVGTCHVPIVSLNICKSRAAVHFYAWNVHRETILTCCLGMGLCSMYYCLLCARWTLPVVHCPLRTTRRLWWCYRNDRRWVPRWGQVVPCFHWISCYLWIQGNVFLVNEHFVRDSDTI